MCSQAYFEQAFQQSAPWATCFTSHLLALLRDDLTEQLRL